MVRLESEPTLRTEPSSSATRARARWPVLITSPQKTCWDVEAATCCAPRTTLTIGTTAVIFPALCDTWAETPTGTAKSKQTRIAITVVAGGRAVIVLSSADFVRRWRRVRSNPSAYKSVGNLCVGTGRKAIIEPAKRLEKISEEGGLALTRINVR